MFETIFVGIWGGEGNEQISGNHHFLSFNAMLFTHMLMPKSGYHGNWANYCMYRDACS